MFARRDSQSNSNDQGKRALCFPLAFPATNELHNSIWVGCDRWMVIPPEVVSYHCIAQCVGERCDDSRA